ncbi:MAG: EBSC protein [Micrococcales bacterium]|nr:MAG: EBSC protein [Micrococcales bacterium]PIE28021.1 MAG: EBSC protein [Micrococcales bacterium]
MSIERARAHLARFGLADSIIETEHSSATVELAAAAVGTQPERIAKSLSFLVDGSPVLVVTAGDARVDNHKFRQRFAVKPRMIPAEDVQSLVGHAVGGVCPFGVEPGVQVYLDESLRRFETVFPACGNDRSAVELPVPALQAASGSVGWVDVCRIPG